MPCFAKKCKLKHCSDTNNQRIFLELGRQSLPNCADPITQLNFFKFSKHFIYILMKNIYYKV